MFRSRYLFVRELMNECMNKVFFKIIDTFLIYDGVWCLHYNEENVFFCGLVQF